MTPHEICEAWAPLVVRDVATLAPGDGIVELLTWAADPERDIFTDLGRGPWQLRFDAAHVWTETWAYRDADEATASARYDSMLPAAEAVLACVLAAANAR